MLLSYRPADTHDFYGIRRNPPTDITRMNELGVTTPTPMRFLLEEPYIEYRDLTKPDGIPVNFDDFKGAITLPNWLDCSIDNHFVPERCRMTVVKWGDKPEECGKITIAEENWMGFFSIISYVGVTLGKNLALASGIVIMDCVMDPVDPTKPAGLDNCFMAPVSVGDHTWIGAHTIIMPGVNIGHHCTIGGHSVVTKDIPPHCVAIGNPAEVITRYQ